MNPLLTPEERGKLITRYVHDELQEIKEMTKQLQEVCAEIHHIKKMAVKKLKTKRF